ncbi:FecR domain-containing protein [Curvivirga sp.]|uniref:FecR domain-containing protein n=1 Tax=Curvivirga sp. TaxID=2856848 RepID=UPI003B5B0A36
MARSIIDASATSERWDEEGTSFNESSVFSTNTFKDVTFLDGAESDVVSLPSRDYVTDAQIYQEGLDLHLELPDGQVVVVEGYFDQVVKPTLVAQGELKLTSELVESFILPLAPGQVAEVIDGHAGDPIGTVSFLSGNVVAVRTDGTRVELKLGDPVYQGDQIQTDPNGSVKMRFVDETVFTLGENARLALDELVYDSSAGAGQTAFSILKGSFVFMSGNIAHNNYDDMSVTTPVATIGIRGTTVSGSVLVGDQAFTFSLLEGSIIIQSGEESIILTESFDTVIGEFSNEDGIRFNAVERAPQEVISHSKSAFGALSPSDINRLEKVIETEIKEETGEVIDVDLNSLIESAGVSDDKLNDEANDVEQQAEAETSKPEVDDQADAAGTEESEDENQAGLNAEDLEDLAENLDEIETAAGEGELDEFSDDVTTVVEDGASGGVGQDEGDGGAVTQVVSSEDQESGGNGSNTDSNTSQISPTDTVASTPSSSSFSIDFSSSVAGATNIISNSVVSDDSIRGSSHGDALSGGGGDDYLYSGAGDDTVSGGVGDDTIQGGTGAGDDFYDGGQGNDSLIYPSVGIGQKLEVELGVGTISEDSEFVTEDVLAVAGEDIIGEIYSTVTDGEGSDTNYVDNDIFVNMNNIELGADDDTIYVNNSDFSDAMNINVDGKDGTDNIIYQDFNNVEFAINSETIVATYAGISQTLSNIETISGDTDVTISYDGTNSQLTFAENDVAGSIAEGDTFAITGPVEEVSVDLSINIVNAGILTFGGNIQIIDFTLDNSAGELVVETGSTLRIADGELTGNVTVKSGAELYLDAGVLSADLTVEDGASVYLASEGGALEFGADLSINLEGDGAVYLDDSVLEIDGDLSFGGEFNQGTLVLSDSTINLNEDAPVLAPDEAGVGGTITSSNVGRNDQGFSVSAYTVNDDGDLTDGVVSINGEAFGVTGVSAAGGNGEIGYDYANQASEELKIEFDYAVTSATVDVSTLYKNEGNKYGLQNAHEQGQWAAYSNGVLVGTGVFVATSGDNLATIDIDIDGSFDTLILSATEYASGQDQGPDSSDYWVTNISYEWATEENGGPDLQEFDLDATLRVEGESSVVGDVNATDGTLEFVDGATLTVTGELDLSGSATITGDGVLDAEGGLNVVEGNFELSDQITLTSTTISVADNAVLDVNGTLENDSGISGGVNSQFIMQDSGTLITASKDGALSNIDFSNQGTFTASGTLELHLGDDVEQDEVGVLFVQATELNGSFHDLYVLNEDGSDTYTGLNDDEETLVGLISRDDDSFDLRLVVADGDGTGSTGDDIFAGSAGDDTAASGSAGQDVFYGFAGNDTFTLSNADFGANKSGYADGGIGGTDTLILDGVDADFDLWQVNGFEVLDVTDAADSFDANDLTEDFVLGLTEDQNEALTASVGTDGAQNALILFDTNSMDMTGSEFADTGEVVTLTNMGDYNGSYSIYEAGEAKLYVYQPIAEVA